MDIWVVSQVELVDIKSPILGGERGQTQARGRLRNRVSAYPRTHPFPLPLYLLAKLDPEWGGRKAEEPLEEKYTELRSRGPCHISTQPDSSDWGELPSRTLFERGLLWFHLFWKQFHYNPPFQHLIWKIMILFMDHKATWEDRKDSICICLYKSL